MNIDFVKLTTPTSALVDTLNRWGNDPYLKPLSQPNQSKSALEQETMLTVAEVRKSLEYKSVFLIYLDNQLIGDMSYIVDFEHLFKKEAGTAWISITIGESEGRGKGIGAVALDYLEEQIKKHGLTRIELGVFEFNGAARKLYQKLGYQEIGRIEDFTYYEGNMWSDIRMEKYLRIT